MGVSVAVVSHLAHRGQVQSLRPRGLCCTSAMRFSLTSTTRNLALAPLWIAQIGTKAKSFRDNPILGSPRLNKWGLHAARRKVADAMSRLRRPELALHIAPQERARFDEIGYFLRHDALDPEHFAALRHEIEEVRLPAREMRQGGTVTRRIGLDDLWLMRMPATRRFLRDPAVRALIHYAASYAGLP